MDEDHTPHSDDVDRDATSTENIPENSSPEETGSSRRDFLKQSVTNATGAVSLKQLIGGAAGVAAAGIATYAGLQVNGTPQDEFPVPVKPDYKPVDQRNLVHTFAASKKLGAKHPERKKAFGNWDFQKVTAKYRDIKNLMMGRLREEPGYTQLDSALDLAGWSGHFYMGGAESSGSPNLGVYSWDQSDVHPNQYQFKTKEEASLAIKSAARIFHATRCGITPRDKRWDYDPLYDVVNEREVSWDEFPFEPKTVIVMLIEMDYQNVATSPMYTSGGTIGEGYTMMAKLAFQISKFLKGLGYHAVASGNSLGGSVPYGIAAGLGEGGRNGGLLAPFLGNRHRMCKVYTDFEFVEYDKPRTFGYSDFCMNCKLCAESCPAEAITFEDKPTWGPTYEGSEDPNNSWHNNPGILKFHNDAKKCYKFWTENQAGCTNCITSCVYNKPDVWHHVFIDGLSHVSPGWVHGIMRDLDHVFGYGTTFDEKKVKNFWVSGKNMRGGKTA